MPINTVKLNKVPNLIVEPKNKKLTTNQPNNANKKVEIVEKKVKINFAKKEDPKESLLKIRSGLKKGTGTKSTTDIKNESNVAKKNEPPVTGFKNIKEMIEQSIKKQRVQSTGIGKNKNQGKK